MMKWTLDEFKYELEADPKRKVLFVEGSSDQVLWNKLVPSESRNHSMICTSDYIDIEVIFGGNRARLLKLAEECVGSCIEGRVRIFIDSDYDSISGYSSYSNIVSRTDYRDMESYYIVMNGIDDVCSVYGLNKEDVRACYVRMLKPLYSLRYTSIVSGLHLPINDTISEKFGKYVLGKNIKEYSINLDKIITSSLQNANISISKKHTVLEEVNKVLSSIEDKEVPFVIHGKDLVGFISHLTRDSFEVSSKSILLFLLAKVDDLRAMPNVSNLVSWVEEST
ncbi:hypothetical protein GCM10009093_09230 [Brevundimonas terrae]|uniref:DUF4435 domain-containing protein n=1 Tax=Brevundimonas terrae TaxID=363631 RepID=A0ABN0Y5W9_9CAUL|nr:DUF4435 domain-containing protein [Brevundimonas terrae]NIJ25520.1 hypothetical protein [Brevundimonas terrae]